MPNADKRINVRLTVEEHEALAIKAGALGLTISDYVRIRCLADDARPHITVDAETLKALYTDQRRIGGLLNQLLRHINSQPQDLPLLAAQLQLTLEQLSETGAETAKLIVDARTSA
jgi:uncharacterized protein (DUF1778 family)